MKINKDMTIGELMEIAPEKVEILLGVGMHCVGCFAAARRNNRRSMYGTWTRCRRCFRRT